MNDSVGHRVTDMIWRGRVSRRKDSGSGLMDRINARRSPLTSYQCGMRLGF